MTRRPLSDSERRLWEQVRETVTPLRGRPVAKGRNAPGGPQFQDPFDVRVPKDAGEVARRQTAPRSNSVIKPAEPKSKNEVKPAAFTQKERRRLSRGVAGPDARIDLHGMHQATAFHALLQFLRNAQAAGDRTVLVITGKGGPAGERGVLRRTVPHWLANGEFRNLVSGIETASRRHGGDGAFYVKLRRRR